MRDDGPTPTISRAGPDGTLIELLYQPDAKTTALAVGRPDGRIDVVSEFTATSGERLVPYSANNSLIATECILLPSDVGVLESKAGLLADIGDYLHRYVDLPDLFADLAAHYVLLSWVYDAFNELPYLRFRGDFGTGKTRALIALGSICYKPFFASGASTVSPIFHVLEAFRGTLVLDEADFRFSDATASLTKILNNGNVQGMPVLRTMSNHQRELNPRAYRVYGPKLLGMRGRFSDVALESRFITHQTGGKTLRDDIPVQLPAALRTEAQALRNKLLAWRLRARAAVRPATEGLPTALSPRTRQVALPLFALMDDVGLRARFTESLLGQDVELQASRSPDVETHLLAATLESFAASQTGSAPVADIAERFNARAADDLGRPMSNRWVGGLLRSRLGVRTIKTGGVYVIPPDARAQLSERMTSETNVPSGNRVTHSAYSAPVPKAPVVGDDGDVAPP